MKAKIEQVNRYKITIGDAVYEGFEKAGEWEGMIKFVGPAGVLIVDAQQESFSAIFSSVFGEEPTAADFTILKSSPALLPREKETVGD
jgi:hypothetical protein